MSAADLYLKLTHLAETAPNLTVAPTKDTRLWLAQVRAAIKETDDGANLASFEAAMLMYDSAARARVADTILQTLYNAIAHENRNAPASVQGAFIPTGNAHDAVTAVGKILGGAKTSVLLVDPYADASILDSYALFAPEGVSIEVLTDSNSAKPTLKPAAEAWQKQYASARPLTVRLSAPKALHDRLIVIDQSTTFTVGQSFNALAARSPTSIVRITDADTSKLKIEAYRQIWSASDKLV